MCHVRLSLGVCVQDAHRRYRGMGGPARAPGRAAAWQALRQALPAAWVRAGQRQQLALELLPQQAAQGQLRWQVQAGWSRQARAGQSRLSLQAGRRRGPRPAQAPAQGAPAPGHSKHRCCPCDPATPPAAQRSSPGCAAAAVHLQGSTSSHEYAPQKRARRSKLTGRRRANLPWPVQSHAPAE